MAYTVAHAEVDVVPSARGFGESLRAQVAPEADRIGREAGDKIADGIKDRVRLALAKLPDANVDLDLDTAGATAQVDAFLADTKVKAAVAGDGAGETLGRNMADSTGQGFKARSALIGTAVGLGLAAGAPLAIAGAGVLFGGLAAVILHNQEDVGKAASNLGAAVTSAYSHVADSVVPKLTSALGQIQRAAVQMAPAVRQVFDNLGPAIQGVTDGVIGLVRNALPGLAAAVQQGTPVFQGLAALLEKIGTGVSNLFTIISAHAGAAGAAFSAFGDIISSLMSIIGELVSAGAELGQTVLPLIASAVHVLADSLHVIQPILPQVLTALLAYRAVGLLSGPLTSFAQKLALASYSGGALSGAAGVASSAVSSFGKALPIVGAAVAVYSAAFEHGKTQVQDWANALIKGGAAARAAQAEINASPSAWDRFSFAVSHGGSTLGMSAQQAREARAAFRELLGQMSPLERAQTLAAKAQNDLQDALKRKDADGAADALRRYNFHTAEAKGIQDGLTAAIDASASATERNKNRLQGLVNTASAANTAIGLLKAGLDALSGKTVSLNDAEVAVTQSVENAKNALQNQTGALTDGTGAINLHTAAGAAAWQALTQLRDASNTLISTMLQQGATTADVAKRDGELRDSFIQTARNMGFTAGQASNLADQILGIPSERKTQIEAPGAAGARDAAKAVADAVNSIPLFRTVHINTISTQGGSPSSTTAQRNALYGAAGGIVQPFASGGFQPMQGGIAQIVAPQTFRLIGDRVTDDEAYIPINDSARSLQILAQTANRMGYELDRVAPGGGGGHSGEIERLAAAVASLAARPTIGQVVTQDNQTGYEMAERLTFLART